MTKHKFHSEHDALILELGFNRPTWLADTLTCNHESFVLDMVLPRVLSEHNVGRMSLLGYANGGFGALHMLMRHPHLFHRAAVCDVPVLGDFHAEVRPWGIQEWRPGGVGKPEWVHFTDMFPHNDMFAPYSSGTLAAGTRTTIAVHSLFSDRLECDATFFDVELHTL